MSARANVRGARKAAGTGESGLAGVYALTLYLLSGTAFGIIAYKSEILSWYRIQEMFRFQSIHMFGVIGSAVVVAALSMLLLKRLSPKSLFGERVSFESKEPGFQRYACGGLTFGVGWALTGACPGPIYALIGSGYEGYLVVLASALLGTWVYGRLGSRLPH